MNTAPNRSQWEIVQSWWVLLPFFGLGWLAFLYIGLRVGYKKWQLFGLLYLIPLLLWLIAAGSVLGQLAAFLIGLSIVVSIGHAFFVRRPFLTRLESLQRQNLQRNEIVYQLGEWVTLAQGMMSAAGSSTVRSRIVEFVKEDPDSSLNTTPKLGHMTPTQQAASQPMTKSFTATGSVALDVNHATEQEIASLPGMTDILAKRVVVLRQECGGFRSVYELGPALGLKPHIVERLRPFVVFSPDTAVHENRSEQRAREIDSGQAPNVGDGSTSMDRGREVDF